MKNLHPRDFECYEFCVWSKMALRFTSAVTVFENSFSKFPFSPFSRNSVTGLVNLVPSWRSSMKHVDPLLKSVNIYPLNLHKSPYFSVFGPFFPRVFRFFPKFSPFSPHFPIGFTEALVRFVYARCGAQLAPTAAVNAAASALPRRLRASEEEGLRRAVQDHRWKWRILDFRQKNTGWWFGTWLDFMTFHMLGRIIPTDELIFFRGIETTNQNRDFTKRNSDL